MIVFEDVNKAYDPDVVGLQDFTCHIGKGEFVFLVGPSGSGKSTLIKLVLKELVPESGRILVAGRNLGTCLLYTSDAADDLLCVDLGGRRIIKKKKKNKKG